jgi:SSS family solute:Na+ symporter
MDIDLSIVVLYLVVTLGFGIWSGRGVRTIREFAVDNGGMSTWALYATIFATYIGGGSTIGVAEKAFSSGVVYPLICIISSLGLLFIGLFVAPRMEEHLRQVAISPGELAGRFWGKGGHLTTGIVGMINVLGGVAAQVSAMGYIFQNFLGTSFTSGVWMSFGLLVVYSAFGGIRAVIATDAIQYVVLIISFPLIAYFSVANAGGAETLFASVPADHLSLAPLWEESARYLPILVSFLISFMDPAWVQRLLMGCDVFQTKKAFCLSSLTTPFSFLCFTLIGLSTLVTNPEMDTHSVVTHTIQTIVPIGFRGLVIAGLLAVLMSTADSYLNLAGVMLACDVLYRKTASDVTDREMLRYGRMATFGLGIFSLFAALYFKDIVDIVLYFNSIWDGTVSIPLAACLMGYKSTKHAFKWAAGVGGTIAISWILFDLEKKTGAYGLFPAMTANVLLFFGLSSYDKHNGLFEKEEIARIQERIRAFNALRKIEREIDAQGGLEAVARRSTNDDPTVPPR